MQPATTPATPVPATPSRLASPALLPITAPFPLRPVLAMTGTTMLGVQSVPLATTVVSNALTPPPAQPATRPNYEPGAVAPPTANVQIGTTIVELSSALPVIRLAIGVQASVPHLVLPATPWPFGSFPAQPATVTSGTTRPQLLFSSAVPASTPA